MFIFTSFQVEINRISISTERTPPARTFLHTSVVTLFYIVIWTHLTKQDKALLAPWQCKGLRVIACLLFNIIQLLLEGIWTGICQNQLINLFFKWTIRHERIMQERVGSPCDFNDQNSARTELYAKSICYQGAKYIYIYIYIYISRNV